MNARAHIGEIDEAVRAIEALDSSLPIALLHCVLEYPTVPENANLGMIGNLSDVFSDHIVGYSDHVCPDDNMLTLKRSR